MNSEAQAMQTPSVAVREVAQGDVRSVHATPKRRLATILLADVVGYARLMQQDDCATLEILKRHRARIGEISATHDGRIVNMPGDSIMVEFASALEAVAAAVEIQDSIEGSNQAAQPHQRMHFRIGMDLGDILVDADGSVYGNGVNIAARMEAVAPQGGIVMSGKVFDEVPPRLRHRFHALGSLQIKNIRDRVRAYQVLRQTAVKQRSDRSRSFELAASDRYINERGGLIAILHGLLSAVGANGVSIPVRTNEH